MEHMMPKAPPLTCVRVADVIATLAGKFVLIERQKFPFGLALPGGHVERGERPAAAARRECTEETGLMLHNVRYVTKRKNAHRDPRYAMSETRVYAGIATGSPKDEEGSTKVVLLTKKEILDLPREQFAFDHHEILTQFLKKQDQK